MKAISTITMFLFLPMILFAHGNKHENKKNDTTVQAASTNKDMDTLVHRDNAIMPEEHHSGRNLAAGQLPTGIEDFPSFHPLVVHFPIVLILLAFLIQFVIIMTNRKEFNFFVFVLALIGFAGAIIAAKFIHPHTARLSPASAALLERHELFASFTVWLSGSGVLAKAVSFIYKKKAMEWIVGIILFLAAACVSLAGHHGAELVHKFGIGPKGNYLEQNHTH